MATKVEVDLTIPDHMVREFLQYLRTWESARTDEVQMKIWIPESKIPGDQMLAIFQSLHPPFPHHLAVRFPGSRPKGRDEN